MYVRIISYATRSSNWVNVADKQLLGRDGLGTGVADISQEWAKLQAWLKHLVSLNLWGQAQAILTLLCGRDPKKRSIPYDTSCGLFEWLSHEAEVRFADSQSESEGFWHASIHLSFGRFLISNQNTIDGRSHLCRARSILSRYSSATDPVCFYPWSGIDLRLEEIKVDIDSAQDRVDDIRALVGLARENEDITSESDLLDSLLDVKPEYLKSGELEGILDRLEEVNEKLGPNVSDLILTRHKVWRIVGRQQSGGLLEWYDRFERKYPTSPIIRYGQPPIYPVETPKTDDYFDIPMTLFYKAIAKTFIRGSLMDTDGYAKAQQEMDLFQSNLDMTFLQKLAGDVDGVKLSRGKWSEFSAIVDNGIEVLTKMLQDSQRRQRLRRSDITAIFQDDINVVMRADLSQISTETMRDAFFEARVSSAQFLARMSAIQRWLDYDDHSSRQSFTQTMIICLFMGFISTKADPTGNVIQDAYNVDDHPRPDIIGVSEALVCYLHSCNDDVRERWLALRVRMELLIIRHSHWKLLGEDADHVDLTRCHHDCLKLLQECKQSHLETELLLIAAFHLEIAQLGLSMTTGNVGESQILSHLDEADDCFEQLRSELSALSSEHALTLKSQWRAIQLDNSILLNVAIQRCKNEVIKADICENATRRDLMATDLWDWVQKSKGRAINDLLGVSATTPRQMEEAVHRLVGGKEMLDQWIQKRQNLQEHPTHQGRKELHALELRMQHVPETKELIALARGKAVTAKDMNALLKTLPEAERSKVVLIDWFEPAIDKPVVEELTMIIFRYDEAPQMFPLDSSLMGRVRTWVNTIPGSVTPEWGMAWGEAQQLRGLIKPLLHATKPDDVLVLCPTGILHRFPLHALLLPPASETGGEEKHKVEMTLLERNALIYIPSMSLFRLCAYARTDPSASTLSGTNSFRAAIATPLPRGGPSIGAFSRFLGCDAYQGRAVDTEKLISLCEEADLFQFYGHVHNRDEVNPLNAHLLLYTGPGDSEENVTCDGNHDEDAMLSAKDIISRVKFREGAHVNLIACDSGVSYAAHGDDLLGLLSAIFLAGARSACTTLWPVASSSAGEWIELLTAEWKLARGRSGGQASFVNLAQCVRSATLELMKQDGGNQEDDMETWAPYVYHGFWNIRDKVLS